VAIIIAVRHRWEAAWRWRSIARVVQSQSRRHAWPMWHGSDV